MLSVVLAVYNEEKNIIKCLDSVKSIADEIVVVDGGSGDKTVEIAKNYQAKVVVTDNPAIFHINKQKAVDLATNDWILQLDADEVVTPGLAEEIKSVIRQKEAKDGYYLKRKNYFLGKWLSKGGQYPDPVIRLFKKGKGKFPCQSVHEQIGISGSVGTLQNDLIHFTAPTFADYLKHSDRYTSLSAEEYKKENLPVNAIKYVEYVIIKPLTTFLKIYFRHKGFVDGMPGFIFALFSGLHFAKAYIKYIRLNK